MTVDLEYTRERLIADMVDAYETAKKLAIPAVMVSAAKSLGLACGHYRQEPLKARTTHEGQEALDRLNGLSDAGLVRIVAAGVG